MGIGDGRLGGDLLQVESEMGGRGGRGCEYISFPLLIS